MAWNMSKLMLYGKQFFWPTYKFKIFSPNAAPFKCRWAKGIPTTTPTHAGV